MTQTREIIYKDFRIENKIKATKLKDIFKRALVDLKRKGRIDTGDRNLDKFLNFFVKEDSKKIILLIDQFLSLAKMKNITGNIRLSTDSMDDENSDSTKSLKYDMKKEEDNKLINLKLQAINEEIQEIESKNKTKR